jgi:hypothetical protein
MATNVHHGEGIKCHTSIKPKSNTNRSGNVTMPNTGHSEYVESRADVMPRAVASWMVRGAVTSQSSLIPQSSLRYLGDG